MQNNNTNKASMICQTNLNKKTLNCLETDLQKYNTCFSRSGDKLNGDIKKTQKTCWRLLSHRSQCACSSIKTFDISDLYTTIPHMLLKSGIKELIHCCFSKKNGKQRYQYLVIGRDKSYFVKKPFKI